MTTCEVCGVRTLKTRAPFAHACNRCGKALCDAHTHYYVDGQNIAITKSAPPQCATCAGMVTIHCFFGGCSHIVEHRDPKQGSRVMQEHYDRSHAADLTQLGYPTEPALSYADNLLPDLDGYVHGVVGSIPVWIIQCDGCGRIAVGDLDPRGHRSNMVVQFCGIEFGGPATDPRRLCGRCRVASYWEDYATRELRARPADLEVGERWMRDPLPPFAEVVLSAEAGRYKAQSKKVSYLTGWWASRALQDPNLPDEDREMAEAAYARSMDVQMGTAGKGKHGGLREIFPIGADLRAEREVRAEEERVAAEVVEDGALFALGALA